jgi:hypothetical protein
MTWKHVASLFAALMLPVICGFSGTCAQTSLKEVIGLSMVVVAGVLGNAQTTKEKDPNKVPADKAG